MCSSKLEQQMRYRMMCPSRGSLRTLYRLIEADDQVTSQIEYNPNRLLQGNQSESVYQIHPAISDQNISVRPPILRSTQLHILLRTSRTKRVHMSGRPISRSLRSLRISGYPCLSVGYGKKNFYTKSKRIYNYYRDGRV